MNGGSDGKGGGGGGVWRVGYGGGGGCGWRKSEQGGRVVTKKDERGREDRLWERALLGVKEE